MRLIDYASYKEVAPTQYGATSSYIRLRLTEDQAVKFEQHVKDMSIIKSHVVYKGKHYVHYLYRGTSANAGYVNIIRTLSMLNLKSKP